MVAKNRISGIICEFNPLHNGHAALLKHLRQDADDRIVCVMSGNFVQRGEAAVLDKWSRTRLALENGADLHALQELMGHADASSTQLYAKLVKGRLTEVYDKAHPKSRKS